MTSRRACWCGVVALPVALALAATPGASASGPRVELCVAERDRRVDVLVDGQLFTAYRWPDSLAKPVLFPIHSAGGQPVTRGFPLEPRQAERVDHPHQVGLWFNHGDLNGVDFWNNSQARSAGERAKMGRVRHQAIEQADGGAGVGVLRVALDWVMPDGSIALHERAQHRFFAGPGRRAIDRDSSLTAGSVRAVFTDNKEGLFAVRVARALEQPSGTPVALVEADGSPGRPRLDDTGLTGLYRSSEGLEGDAVWGSRARWVALSGRIGGEDLVLLMLDHPGNPGHPGHWHARGYGLFATNPLGAGAFTNGRERLDLGLEPGEAVRFRHRLVILSRTFSAAEADAEWRSFASAGDGRMVHQ